MRSALRIVLFALDALSWSYHSSVGSDSIYSHCASDFWHSINMFMYVHVGLRVQYTRICIYEREKARAELVHQCGVSGAEGTETKAVPSALLTPH